MLLSRSVLKTLLRLRKEKEEERLGGQQRISRDGVVEVASAGSQSATRREIMRDVVATLAPLCVEDKPMCPQISLDSVINAIYSKRIWIYANYVR